MSSLSPAFIIDASRASMIGFNSSILSCNSSFIHWCPVRALIIIIVGTSDMISHILIIACNRNHFRSVRGVDWSATCHFLIDSLDLEMADDSTDAFASKTEASDGVMGRFKGDVEVSYCIIDGGVV